MLRSILQDVREKECSIMIIPDDICGLGLLDLKKIILGIFQPHWEELSQLFEML